MQNHYVIGKIRHEEGVRLLFGKVSNVTKGIVEGTIEKDSHVKLKRALFEIPIKDVVLDLGERPHPGKAYGFDISHLYTGKVVHHDFFGPIHFFYRIKREVYQELITALDRAAKILKKHGLPEPDECVWEINSPEVAGKYAGYYKHSKNAEQNPHRFAIKPESLPTSEFVYVIIHEYTHWLHRNHLTSDKLNAHWIRLYNTSIKVQTIKKETSVYLRDSLLAGEERPSDFKSSLDEAETLAFAWIMRTIKQDHAVSIRELDTLFTADQKDEIESVWPARTLHKKDLAPVLSEYATVNYNELIAEAFAFYLTNKTLEGKKMPESIARLVERSIRLAKGGGNA